jgi:hypothetical protein
MNTAQAVEISPTKKEGSFLMEQDVTSRINTRNIQLYISSSQNNQLCEVVCREPTLQSYWPKKPTLESYWAKMGCCYWYRIETSLNNHGNGWNLGMCLPRGSTTRVYIGLNLGRSGWRVRRAGKCYNFTELEDSGFRDIGEARTFGGKCGSFWHNSKNWPRSSQCPARCTL